MTDTTNPAAAGPGEPPTAEPGTTRFTYGDDAGRPLFHVTRGDDAPGFARPGLWGPAPDGSGWQPDLTALPGPLPLFDLVGILTYRDATVVLHPCERDAVRAREAGLEGLHTTTAMGVGHAAASDFAPLAGRRVVVVPDASSEGYAYAAEVQGLAQAAGAASVTVLHLPGLAPGTDLNAWLAGGGTPAGWADLLAATRPARAAAPEAPAHVPAPAPPAPELEPRPRVAAGEPLPFAEPEPLPSGTVPLPPFDLDLLPGPLGGFAADIAARTGSPAVVPAVTVLAALGAVVGRRLGLLPRAGEGHPVVPNLWAAVVADGPAFRDGAALEAALAPLERLEWLAREAFVREDALNRARKAAYAIARKVWRERVRGQATRENAPGEDATALAALHPAELVPPVLRRYRTGTGTLKSLVRLLDASPGGALLAAGDLAAWVRHRSAPEREGERDFLLRCWSGTAPGFPVDTPAGPALHCTHPCLSVLGWITADARARLLAPGIDRAGAHDLLARFTLTVCADRSAGGAPAGPEDPKARAGAEAVFERVEETVRGAGGRGGAIPSVPFEAKARAFAEAWQADRVVRVAGIEDAGLALAVSRQGERMPALALLLHLAEAADGCAPHPVPAAAARRAAAWCELLEAHTRRLHGAAGPEPDHAAQGAHALLGHLLEGDLASPFTLRDVYRRHWSGLATRAQAQAAVGLLERHGYLAARPVPTTARGGKPTRVYHLNPRAAGAAPA